MERINNGLIILDKPPGHTSHEISAFVKKIVGANKSGHAGTLDPNVSGVLPIALGRDTKLLQYIASADKTYVGLIKFKNIQSKEQIESYFKNFRENMNGRISSLLRQKALQKRGYLTYSVFRISSARSPEVNPSSMIKPEASSYTEAPCGVLFRASKNDAQLRSFAVPPLS